MCPCSLHKIHVRLLLMYVHTMFFSLYVSSGPSSKHFYVIFESHFSRNFFFQVGFFMSVSRTME